MAELRLENIHKLYDKQMVAVNDFNLQVKDNEFIVFVGPSGCGKSTTLRMIAGLEEVSKGDFYIDNKRMNEVEPKDRDIAMVFQNYALYPHMDVYNNMAFGLKLRKVPKPQIDALVKEAASILGLTQYLNRKPKALSGGQRQRVALGRAIVRNPKVFLMDEPLSNLDAKLRVQMRAEIMKLHRRLHTTTIYVTHDQTEAMTMASRLVVMKDGVIQQIGTPQEVYESPNNMFVADFIGSPSMNFIKGTYINGSLIIGEQIITLHSMGNRNGLEKYEGLELIMGIRPEHISEHSTVFSKTGTFQAEVEVIEMTGAEKILHTVVNETNIVARVDPDSKAKQNEKVTFYLNLNKVHFFDIKSEQRIILK